MPNFDEADQTSIAGFVLDGLKRHKQFALASVDNEGSPWCVCLNLSFDDNLTIIWKSLQTTEHSKHIKNNPNVSICVFSETQEVGDFGFYTKAVAHEVTDLDELKHLITIRFAGKDAPDPDTLLQPDGARLYAATIKEAWVNDDRHQKTKVDMQTLRRVAKG